MPCPYPDYCRDTALPCPRYHSDATGNDIKGRRAEARPTNNIGDFERFARACEVHAGIIFISESDLLGSEQIAIVKEAVAAIYTQLEAGRDMVNLVLSIAAKGTKNFETFPPNM